MAYQEIKTTGYGERVGNSFKAIGTGLLLFIGGTILLWWNEGRAVKTDKMLKEAESAYVDMENPNKIDPSFNGQLICASALATTEDSLVDPQFGIGAKAIALERSVEYYQWVEHEEATSRDKMGGKKETTYTYTYTKEWVGSPIQSSEFKDVAYQNKNTVLTTIQNADLWAEHVTFGAYQLNESLIHSIASEKPLQLNINPNLLRQFDRNVRNAYQRFYGNQPALTGSAATPAENDSLQAPADNKTDLDFVHQNANQLYFGRIPGAPEVGDVRVTFTVTEPAEVTVMAEVNGDTFKPYKAKNGKRFQTLVMGKKSADEIFEGEHRSNNMLLWALRCLGVMLVIGGLKGIFGFIETLLKVIPFVANIFGWGVGMVCTVVGFVWSLIVIAMAWLFYRPLLGIALLVLAGLLIWTFAFKGKEKLQNLAVKSRQDQPQQPL